LTLVLDANVVVPSCLAPGGFDRFEDDLVAPPLMWPEARSALHLAVWRGLLEAEDALRGLRLLELGPVGVRSPAKLGREAWRIADELGMGRTHDAEYLALAELLRCRLVTADGRLSRRAAHLDYVVGPTDL